MEHEPNDIAGGAKQTNNLEGLTAFQKLLKGDAAARSAVLGHLVPIASAPEGSKIQEVAPALLQTDTEISLKPKSNSTETLDTLPPLAPPPVGDFIKTQSRGPVESVKKMGQTEKIDSMPVPSTNPDSASRPQSSIERSSPRPVASERLERSEQSLGTIELEQLAKTIMVDGISLQEIYATKQIDEEGLRAVVEIHLRGGNVDAMRRQLNQEIIEQQRKFERDPFYKRDNRTTSQADNQTDSASRLATTLASKKIISQSVLLVGAVASSTRKATKDVAKKAGKSISDNVLKAQDRSAQSSLTSGTSDARNWISIAAVVVIYSIILILLLN